MQGGVRTCREGYVHKLLQPDKPAQPVAVLALLLLNQCKRTFARRYCRGLHALGSCELEPTWRRLRSRRAQASMRRYVWRVQVALEFAQRTSFEPARTAQYLLHKKVVSQTCGDA